MLKVFTDKDLKTYWKIGEVAEMIGQATSLVRYWGAELAWTRPKYGKLGQRQFTRENAQEVLKVNYLIKHKGMTLDGVRQAYVEGYLNDLIEFYESLPAGEPVPQIA